jgi:transposase
MSTVEQLKRENARLRRALGKREAQFSARESELEHEIALLLERLNVVLAQRFGVSSEKSDEAQLSLFNEAQVEPEPELEADQETAVEAASSNTAAAPKRRSGKRALPAELERVEVRHELAQAQRLCPHDGTPLTVIGKQGGVTLTFRRQLP